MVDGIIHLYYYIVNMIVDTCKGTNSWSQYSIQKE